jgi:2-oxoglutarate ferredoxin oxidoreductase subunit delta
MGDLDRGDVKIAAHLCKGCCLCVAACPPAVLSQGDFLNRQGYYAVSYCGSGCTGCGICFYVCPEPGAINVSRQKSGAVSSSKPGARSMTAESTPAVP